MDAFERHVVALAAVVPPPFFVVPRRQEANLRLSLLASVANGMIYRSYHDEDEDESNRGTKLFPSDSVPQIFGDRDDFIAPTSSIVPEGSELHVPEPDIVVLRRHVGLMIPARLPLLLQSCNTRNTSVSRNQICQR